jgi:hypothetical protein
VEKSDMMNEDGSFLMVIGVALGLIILSSVSLPIIMKLFPPADLIIKIILIFVIITTVRGYLGSSVITLIVSGILIYFLILKWWWVTSSVWFFTTLLTFGLLSLFVWGTSKIIPAH